MTPRSSVLSTTRHSSMGARTLHLILLFACISKLTAEGNGGDSSAVAAGSPPSSSAPAVAAAVTPAANSKAPKTLAAIARGISRLENKLQKLTNRIDRLGEMERLKKIMRNIDKQKLQKSKKHRRGASVAASAGKRGAAVAVSASRRASGGTGASNGKKRKPAKRQPTPKPKPAKRQKPVTANPAKRRRPAKKRKPLPMVGFHKNKRGGTSVAVSAGNAAAGAAASD